MFSGSELKQQETLRPESEFLLRCYSDPPYDIWATADLVELIKARREVTEGRPQAAFLVSRAIRRTVLSREIHAALAEYGLPVFAAGTVQRQSYPRTAALGQTVFDDGSPEAARGDRRGRCRAPSALRSGEHLLMALSTKRPSAAKERLLQDIQETAVPLRRLTPISKRRSTGG